MFAMENHYILPKSFCSSIVACIFFMKTKTVLSATISPPVIARAVVFSDSAESRRACLVGGDAAAPRPLHPGLHPPCTQRTRPSTENKL